MCGHHVANSKKFSVDYYTEGGHHVSGSIACSLVVISCQLFWPFIYEHIYAVLLNKKYMIH